MKCLDLPTILYIEFLVAISLWLFKLLLIDFWLKEKLEKFVDERVKHRLEWEELAHSTKLRVKELESHVLALENFNEQVKKKLNK